MRTLTDSARRHGNVTARSELSTFLFIYLFLFVFFILKKNMIYKSPFQIRLDGHKILHWSV